MTSPTPPVVIQQQGFGQAVQQGLAPLLQALQVRQQDQRRQQQLGIQQQQVELQKLSQRSLERERVIDRVMQFADMFGPDILEDPQLAAQLEEAGIKPATILKRHKAKQKQEQDAIKVQREALTGAFPARLRPALKTSLALMDQGAPAGQVSQAFSMLAAEAIDEETLAAINLEFPILADLPPEQRLEAFASLKLTQARAKLGVGKEATEALDRQLKETNLELRKLDLELRRKRDPDLSTALRVLSLIENSMDLTTISLKGLIGEPQDVIVRELHGPAGLRAWQNARRKVLEAGAQIPTAGRRRGRGR